MAFLLDDIILLPLKGPISGFKWIMRTIQKMADEELMNDQPWKERLIELQMQLELGEISEEDYVREEAVDDAVMLALRDDTDSYAPTLIEVAKLAFHRPLTTWLLAVRILVSASKFALSLATSNALLGES